MKREGGEYKTEVEEVNGKTRSEVLINTITAGVVLYRVVASTGREEGTLDLGPGMNDHPGRDTNVRSRPSESTIKDLSFYIGFIKIQSSNKHVGPCFGMNGHFRRDPDTISRLPDTTIHFLSVFIGFEC